MDATARSAAGTAAPSLPGAQPEPDEGRDPAATPRGAGGDSHRVRHWPALDGLRAVAVLAVGFFHVEVLPGGYVGVDVFFVLSGFLITSLLIGEWDKRGGRISFRNFYMRRALRLFPALGCVIIASAALAGLVLAAGGISGRPGAPAALAALSVRSHAVATFGAIPWVVIFGGNWVRALDPSPVLGSLGLLAHTWSLAVEEQFYLLWPALFALLMRRRFSRGGLALSLALIGVADMIYRVAAAHGWYPAYRIYFGTDTHADGLLIGCAVAFWLASGQPSGWHRLTGRIVKGTAWLAATFLVILFVAPTGMPVQISAAVLATGAVLIAVVTGNTPAALERVLSSGWAVRIGRRSYGLYLWQYVIIQAAVALYARYIGIYPAPGERRIAVVVIIAAAIAVSFIAAELSYRFVELPALRLKRRFQGEADASAGEPPRRR